MLLSGLCLGAIVAMLAFIYSTRGPVQISVAMPLETTAAAVTPSVEEPEPSPTPTPAPSSKTSTPKLASQVPGGQLAALVYDRQENKALLAEHADTVFTTASL